MKSPNPLTPQSKSSYRSYIAGILLSIACVLFISGTIHDHWGVSLTSYPTPIYSHRGIWRYGFVQNGTGAVFELQCANREKSYTDIYIARIFVIGTCITSIIGAICLCILPRFRNRYRSILCTIGLCLAILSFIFGMIGFIGGVHWISQFRRNKIASSAISILIGSLLSFASAICVYFLNIKESM